MSQSTPPGDAPGKGPESTPQAAPASGEYLVLLIEETDRARIKFLDRYIAENIIPCHKKGAWLRSGPSIRYFVPESYYLGLCAALSIEPDPVIAERAAANAPEPPAEEEEPAEDTRMPVSRWLPLLIIVGGAIAALIIALVAGALK
ncbi:MAG: hypothetical protein LBU86_02055 [Oscillospiraceae bacterium]|jgi:hypothetical protein|nr:hypothetical protein [Oscillospiraceae bacterium]